MTWIEILLTSIAIRPLEIALISVAAALAVATFAGLHLRHTNHPILWGPQLAPFFVLYVYRIPRKQIQPLE
jgi:hypothetical protein